MATNALQKKQHRTEIARPESTRGAQYLPRVDILETDEELFLYADMPGVKPADLDVRFENGELILYGRCPPRQDGNSYLLCEYGVGDFHRTFSISEDIDADKISAELKNGVLTVRLPKTENVKPRRIQVKGE
jgi:HSP20 family molecular chaperone IbpA